MTYYERRIQRAFDGDAQKRKDPWICIVGKCEFPKVHGDYCIGHAAERAVQAAVDRQKRTAG